jgi:23S rRNA (adenine2030-N6)-methyltransferase
VLGYRHAFHAGNLADVVKHAALTALIDALISKPAPLTYLDTHAGAGDYALDQHDPAAEWRAGIGILLRGDLPQPPAAVAHYVDCVRRYQRAHRRYPGSAVIAAQRLRDDDRLLLAERHPADHPTLAAALAADRRVRVQQADGYALLRSALPPLERRGLVLIDPAYEADDEPARVLAGLDAGLRRFRHGVYLVWYPLIGKHDPADMVRRLRRLEPPKTLRIEIRPGGTARAGAIASGVWIVNPPFQAVAPLGAMANWFARHLVPAGSVRCDWLIAE